MSDMEQMAKDIAHIKLTLDNLSYVMYKKLSAFQKMIYMSKEQIDNHYPEVKDIEIEKPEEPVLPDKGKFKIECHRCGKESLSTGIIILNGDEMSREYHCEHCDFKELH